MKTQLSTLLTCLFACAGWFSTSAYADAPIEDGVYYISNLSTDGYLGLGAYHSVDPYIYYVTDGQEMTEDGWWVVTNTRSGYTFRNQATNQLLVFTYDRVDQFYKYMTLANESPGDHSEYWNIIEGSDGAVSIQSVLDTNYYWNLRSGTYMMGTYSGSRGTGWNERYVFHIKDDKPEPPIEVNHDWVDLDLPSGTLWATCNIGASSPEKYGDYFAWGETTPKKSNGAWGDYSWGTYKWMNAGQADWTQINKYTFADNQTEACWYNSNGTFIGDGKTVLLSEDDAATANWGSEWQMPSVEQMRELIDSENTTSTWTTMNGVNGRLVTSIRNNASIFLPAGGRRNGTETQWEGSYGFYWPNMTDKTYSDRACQFDFSASSISVVGSFDRYAGECIRPVRVEKKKTETQYPSDEYSPYVFPKALHVWLVDGSIEAYPMAYVTNYSEKDGQLVIETNINRTYTYDLADVDSISTGRPDFPTFNSFKFNNDYNDQLFTTANGEMVGDTVFVTLAAIGKRLTPSFKLDEGTEVYAGGSPQTSKESRLRFDKDIYYLVAKAGCRILTPDTDGKYFMQPYGRCVRVHVDWLTDRAEVPTIYINTEDGQPITSKTEYKNATIIIDGHDIFPSMEETPLQIRGRGNSSWGWPKKPYRLKFQEKVKPLGMKKSKSWVLLSNYQTGSLMSNAIGMKAANLMGAAGANHIVPVDVYLNGEYRGSYNLTEKVGFSNNSIDLYDESYAAMLELDSYYDEPEGQKFRSTPYNLPINIKEPEFGDTTKVTYLTLETIESSFNSFLSTLYRGKDISRYVDVEQLARFLMVNELTLNYEFYHPKSTFCYRENFTDDESKYVFGPVWDLDWCFGYERSRSYFRNEATANYWTDMTSMEVTNFVRDIRFKYEPLDTMYCRLWEEFMENDLQELLEYCQDYYDFAHNSFNMNRTVWGDNTNYEQQVQQATDWLASRTEKIYSDIVNKVRPDIQEPVETVKFDNNKLYTIECQRGELIHSYNYNGLEAGQSAWWTIQDFDRQFAIINFDGNNYLYSPYLKKFLRTGRVINGEWVDELGSPIYFDPTKPNGQYTYMISTLTETGSQLWFNNNTRTIVINSYNTPDDGDRWMITEVGDFDPTEALELASQSMLAVTNRYIFNGEVVGTEVQRVTKGSEPPAPSPQWANAFVTIEEPADMPYQITEETTIDYEVQWTGPFDFSTSFVDATWYNMTIRSDYMVGKSHSEPYYPVAVNGVDTLAMPQFQWAFGGNPYKVKVYNRSTGFSQTLTADGDNAVMREGEYEWDLLPNSDGFVLRIPDTEYSCINQFGGPGGPLKFWHDQASPRDNGSTFRLSVVPDLFVYTEFDETTGTLTYYYDTHRSERSGVTEAYDPSALRFTGYFDRIQRAVIDPSMQNAPLTSYRNMFCGGFNSETFDIQSPIAMTQIEGLENLNTDIVTDMNSMFFSCQSLVTLDLNMFNTSKVTDMNGMFLDCRLLQIVDLTSFDISRITDMRMMFGACSSLHTICCYDDWSKYVSPEASYMMFTGCKSLHGGMGTPFDGNYIDATYARPDSRPDHPGYFTAETITAIQLPAIADWHSEDNHIYNTAGQRLSKKQRGINIIAGKKQLIKQ